MSETMAAEGKIAPWDLPRRLGALSGARALGAAAGLGALAALGHAPFFLWPVYAFGLVGLVWLLDGANRRRDGALKAMAARSWAWAFGHFLAGLYWIGSPFLQVEGGAALMIPAVLALPAGLALFWAVGGVIAGALWTSDARRLAAFAFAFGLLELARSTMFTGFPWNVPGVIWPAGGAISQMAALVGVHGLSALTLLALAAPAALADAPSGGSRGFGRRFAPALAAALALGLAWGAGAQRLAAPPGAPGPIVRVVDAGVSQAERWSEAGLTLSLNRYLDLTGAPEDSDAAVVIWPEAALPGLPILDSPELLEALGDVLQNRVLITGTVRVERGGPEETRFFNSLVVLDGVAGSLRVGQVYDKRHLVPFGEYMPFWEFYSEVPLAPLQNIGRGYSRGDPPSRLIVPGAPPVAPMICYEAIFSGFPPRGEDRADWLVNVSVDSWFGGGSGPWQHANLARYRAIEEGLPLARSAARGVSGIFDANGREIVATDLDGGAVQAALPAPLPAPLYARYGFALTAAVLLLMGLLRFAPIEARRRLTS